MVVQYNDLCEQNPEVLAKQQEELQALIAWGNGDETLSEIDPELVAKCDGLDAEYEREWNASKTTISGLGDNGAVRMFLFKFREPDEWSAEWDGRCEQGSDYLEEQTWGLDELVAWRTDKVNDAQERRMLAARNEREAIQRQQAREQENARREAEQQRLARQVREQAPLHFSEGTILWQLVFGEYNAADELAIEWARTEFAEPMSKAAEFFAPGSGYASASYDSAIKNRKNQVIAAYALSRLAVLGSCGEDTVDIWKGKYADDVIRDGDGMVAEILEGQDFFVTAPASFARYVDKASLQQPGQYFRQEIASLGSCDNLVLQELERHLHEYARWTPPSLQ